MKTRLAALLALFLITPVSAAEKAKVVFVSGKPSHGRMSHEHRAGNLILADALNASGLGVEAVVLSEAGYPKDPAVLEDAATVVIFCTGHRGHVLKIGRASCRERV